MFKAQCAEENNRTQCAMENSGKREQRVSGRMVPQLGFWFLMEFLEFVAQHGRQLIVWLSTTKKIRDETPKKR